MTVQIPEFVRVKHCFINADRPCDQYCMAYTDKGACCSTSCHIILALDQWLEQQRRPNVKFPSSPPPPEVRP